MPYSENALWPELGSILPMSLGVHSVAFAHFRDEEIETYLGEAMCQKCMLGLFY